MRSVGLSMAIAVLSASSAMATVGDTWTLGIDHIDNGSFFETFTGAGYSGPQSTGAAQYVGNAYGRGPGGAVPRDGSARIYWSLSGLAMNGDPLPNTTELYSVKYYGTTAPANNDYDPIEVDFNGPGPGDGQASNDPAIPWGGQFGTNHQWIVANNKTPGTFSTAGPGPQAPNSAAYNAAGNGSYVWLQSGSWLYAKWDFSFDVRRSWSAIQVTQVTPAIGPPPIGDFNKNNFVDATDYVLWRKTYDDENPAAGRPADANFDGYVDEVDYSIWQRHFGDKATGISGLAVSSVPEPATFSLAAIVAASLIVRGRRPNSAAGHCRRMQTHNRDQ